LELFLKLGKSQRQEDADDFKQVSAYFVVPRVILTTHGVKLATAEDYKNTTQAVNPFTYI